MSVKHVYEGDSINGNLQEALDNAIHQLVQDIAKGGCCDAIASWVIAEISGKYGGFAGLKNITVKINAK